MARVDYVSVSAGTNYSTRVEWCCWVVSHEVDRPVDDVENDEHDRKET